MPQEQQDLIDDPDYRRSACDHLLEDQTAESEHYEPAEPDGFSDNRLDEAATGSSEISTRQRKAFLVRTLALLCACSLSVGSHYATNILGPLKSRIQRELGTTHTEFGLLFAAYSLNSTWTPLVGGVLASQLGTTFTSILATGVILLGQLLLLLGDIMGNVRLMALGLFIFGFGVSPLAVVQETIIVRFFKSQGLGTSMAFGLVAGKGASFLAARTSYPLTERFGPHAPFYVATSLAGLSAIMNLVYVTSSKWLIDGAEAELEAPDISEEARKRMAINISDAQALTKVAEKRKVHIRQITKLGDVFWAYMGLNFFYGMIWYPFAHLAANIIEHRYSMTEEGAANSASYMLAGPFVLYPLVGFLVDKYKHRPIVLLLLVLSSVFTLISYTWFALPPSWTKTPGPAIFAFAVGHGCSPLLLVLLVPKIVPFKYISTALGAHKSMEQTGSTLFQTLAGLLLDTKELPHSSLQYLLNAFVVLNLLHFGTIFLLALLQWSKGKAAPETGSAVAHAAEQTTPLLGLTQHRPESQGPRWTKPEFRTLGEIHRGRCMAVLSVILVVAAWALFLTTAWYKLGQKHRS